MAQIQPLGLPNHIRFKPAKLKYFYKKLKIIKQQNKLNELKLKNDRGSKDKPKTVS